MARTTAAGSVALVADNLHKRYGDRHAVRGVTFSVAEGEFLGILGPNGAGKTTTLEMLEGLREPDAGTVSVLGHNPWPRNLALLPRMGVQLQTSSFFDRLTAREQLETFGALYGVPARKAVAMLDLVGLEDHADTREAQLSGGQRQRLSIACALVHEPDIVFLDEPTGALDPQARRNLWEVLREIRASGTTIVYTTHYIDEAEILCDRVAIMDHGQILTLGAPETLVRDLGAPTQMVLALQALPSAEANHLPGVDHVTVDRSRITLVTHEPALVLSALAERKAMEGLQVRTASLEDVFLELTGREYRA